MRRGEGEVREMGGKIGGKVGHEMEGRNREGRDK